MSTWCRAAPMSRWLLPWFEGVGIRGAGAAAELDAVAEVMSGCRSLRVVDTCEHVLEPARRACDQLAGRAADLWVLATQPDPA